MNSKKILITGTGRSGTTFLVKLFTILGYDTGFNKNNYVNYISKKCNSGLETYIYDKFYILKNPNFIRDIESILNEYKEQIKQVIIPIRNYKDSAKSRESNGYENGGWWGAYTVEEQEVFYYKLIAKYVYYMTKFDINTTFLDFDRMTTDKHYLYEKLKSIFDEKNVSFEMYSQAYEEASVTSKPKI